MCLLGFEFESRTVVYRGQAIVENLHHQKYFIEEEDFITVIIYNCQGKVVIKSRGIFIRFCSYF